MGAALQLAGTPQDERECVMDGEECEKRVTAMTQRAAELLREVQAQFNISHVMAAFSGGNDSIVSTHWANEVFPDCCVMSADTKIGLQPSRDHICDTIKKFGWTANIKSPEPEGAPKGWVGEWTEAATSYEEFVLNFGFPGPCQGLLWDFR